MPYDLTAVHVIDSLHAICVGNHGIVYVTADCGLTWTPYSIGDTTDLTGVTANGCKGYISGAHGQMYTFNVSYSPTAPLFTTSADTVCNGTNVVLTVTAPKLGSIYKWNNGHTGTTDTVAVTGNYVVTEYSACDTLSSVVHHVVVNPTLTPGVAISPSIFTTICAGTPITFTATSNNGGATPVYQWKKNHINVGTNSITYTDSALANNDTISCTLTSSAACASPATASSNTIAIIVNPILTPSVSISASPSTSVNTGTVVTYSAAIANGGSTPNYHWLKNGATVGTNSPSYVDSFVANSDVIRCILTSNANCLTRATDSSNSITMTVLSPFSTWTGGSTVWNNPANWSPAGVPSCAIDVVIPNLPNKPVITGTMNVRNLTINAGGGITINSGSTLQVCGSISNNGIASFGNGNVVLQGAGNQSLAGYTSFGNVEVNGNYYIGGGADVIEVRGILKKTGGTLYTGNKLTLISTATQTALIQENGGSLNGKITMQRYVGGVVGYHHLSSPMTNATVSEWGNDFPITGINGIGAFVAGKEGTLQEYREPSNLFNKLDSGYYNYTTPSLLLPSAKGFTAIIKTLPITVTTFGTPLATTVSATITKSTGPGVAHGWNFIGNPYPSPMSWTALKALNVGKMDGTCYLWKSTGLGTGTWQAYNGTAGVNGVGDIISSTQGFFMKSSLPSSTISFDNSIRTLDLSPVFYKTYPLQQNEIRLSLTNTSNSDESDETVAYTAVGATDGYDADVDAIKLDAPIGATQSSSIAYHIAGSPLSIHVTDAINENTELPLQIKVANSGSYTISLTAMNTSLPVYLKDNSRNTYQDLNAKAALLITQDAEVLNQYSIVFKLATDHTVLDESQVNIYGKTGAVVVAHTAMTQNAAVTVYNLLGQEVANSTMTSSPVELPIYNTEGAIYLVQVKEPGKAAISKKVFVAGTLK